MGNPGSDLVAQGFLSTKPKVTGSNPVGRTSDLAQRLRLEPRAISSGGAAA